MQVVECHGLVKKYGGRPVVDGLSLSIEEGEVFGLLGPNGAGKTTLMRILLGLVRSTAGGATLFGRPVPPPPEVLRRVGAVVEEPRFYGWMNAREQLRVDGLTAGLRMDQARIAELLESVELERSGGQAIRKYSQGMRQRLGLARAMIKNPSLMVLDEPANGLDPAGIVWLREYLRRLAAAGTTVLVSSHQLDQVEKGCDRVAIIDGGRVIETMRIRDL